MEPASTLIPRKPPRKSTPTMSGGAAEQPNNVTSDVLGENWKSALCVTSLYDSYVALQHENDTLRDQVRQLQHANELLQVEARKTTRRPEVEDDGLDDSQLIKEIRLLRAEKSQQELLFDKRRVQLENQLNEFKALYQEQLEKYQQRFDLDPNEPKRVAMSTVSLQNTLDQVVREKEELAIQHNTLQQMYHKLEQSSQQTTKVLNARVAELEGKRLAQASHRVRSVLEKWVFAKMAHSWKQWRFVVLSDRMLQSQQRERQEQRAILDTKRQHLTQERAAKFVVKLLQSSTRRCFSKWKMMVRRKLELKARVNKFVAVRCHRVEQCAFAQWQVNVRRIRNIVEAGSRLSKLITRHGLRRCWLRWSIAPMQMVISRKSIENAQLTAEIASVRAKMTEMQADYEAIYAAHASLVEQIEQHTVDHSQQLLAHSESRDASGERVADVICRRNRRLQSRTIFQSWRQWSTQQLTYRRKITRVRSQCRDNGLKVVITRWHQYSHERVRLRNVCSRVMQRMRLLGAYRCFLAWREFTAEKKERLATIQRVIHHFKYQQLIRSFKAWDEYRHVRFDHRRRMAAMCLSLERFHVCESFTHWKRALIVMNHEAEQAKREQIEVEWKQRLEQSKQELNQLRLYFQTWQATVSSGKKYRSMTKKYAIKWKNGALGKVFEEWKEFTTVRIQRRLQLQRVAFRRHSQALRCAWSRWLTQVLTIRKDAAINELARHRDELVCRLESELTRLQLDVSAVQATSADREQALITELKSTRQLLTKLQSSCDHYKHAFKAVCVSAHQQRLLRAHVCAWREMVRQSLERRRDVEAMTQRGQTRCLRSVLRAWNGIRMAKKKMEVSMTRLLQAWDAHVSGRCLLVWHEYARRRSLVRKLAQAYEKSTTTRLYRSVFNSWRSEARVNALLRRTVERVWLTSVHARMQHSFKRWTEYTTEDRIRQQLAHKQLAIAAIQAKVCSRWTAMSMKAVFDAWREGVARKKRRKTAAERLRALQSMRLLEITYYAWKAAHETYRGQCRWLCKWQLRQESKAIMEAVSQWKMVVLSARREEQNTLMNKCLVQNEVIASKSHEILELQTMNAELVDQLTRLRSEHSDVNQSAEESKKRVLTVRTLYRWRAFAKLSKSARLNVERLRQAQRLRSQRYMFGQWRGAVDGQRRLRLEAEERNHKSKHRYLSQVVKTWKKYADDCMKMRKAISRFKRRQNKAKLASVLHEWAHFTTLSKSLHRLIPRLNLVASKTAKRNAFCLWKSVTALHRSLALQHAEKQRRIMAFMLDKHEYELAKYFRVWKACALVRHQRMLHVNRLHERSCARRLREHWHNWVVFQDRQRREVDCATVLVKLAARQRLRVGVWHWRRQIVRFREEILIDEKDRLLRQNLDLQSNLEEAMSRAEEATRSMAILQTSHEHLQQSILTREHQLKSADATIKTEACRRAALTNVLLKQYFVSRLDVDMMASFNCWKQRSQLRSCQLGALRRCVLLNLRIRLGKSLSKWKLRTTRIARRDRWLEARQQASYREVWSTWRSFVHHRGLVRRRFLIRWIEGTHSRHNNADLQKKVAIAFRLWRAQSACLTAVQRISDMLASDKDRMCALKVQRREYLLIKWISRVYRAHGQGIQHAINMWKSVTEQSKIMALQHQVAALEKSSKEVTSVKLSATVAQQVTDGLQTLTRRIASAGSLPELFDAITTTFGQVLQGRASAILYLVDPITNELWTRFHDTVQKFPVSIGIAGCSLSSLGSVTVDNAVRDPRFHALVDQLAVTRLASNAGDHGPVSVFSTAVVAPDGSAYGVLQVAYISENEDLRTHAYILGRACGFYVEQIMVDMVRHSRDQVRARSPENFTKLFKQNKQWRKYFAQVEKEALKTQQQLQQILSEQEILVQEKSRLHDAIQQLNQERAALVQEQAVARQQHQNEEILMKHLVAYKKKTAKLREALETSEKQLKEKMKELQTVMQQHEQLRREVQTRDLQSILTGVSPQKHAAHHHDDDNEEEESNNSVDRKALLLRGAEIATLKNELVRSESDSMFLVKAVDIATRHHGELPDTLKMEVNRISLRLKKPRE